MYTRLITRTSVVFILLLTSVYTEAQRYLADYDSTMFIRDTVRPVVNRFNNLYISAYMQPQYQVASEKGAASYAGGNFAEKSNNRFILRRSRIRFDYRLQGKKGDFPAALFTFQFEVTERDANVRDMFARIYEPSRNNFYLTAGLFSRPFGFEVNLSSSFRETPERARISQILMPSERDLGAMVSYEPQRKRRIQIKFDIGVFNGQGKSGPAEFDSYKDLISRLSIKPYQFTRHLSVGAGLSFLNGGWAQATQYRYEMGSNGTDKYYVVDSSLSNIGGKATRRYFGGDMQVIQKHRWGKTEIRGEYWRGLQPGTATTTVNPGTLPTGPTYIRPFDGLILYFLQNIINKKWELMVKYDWYDPNTKVSGMEIGKAGTNLTPADVKYTTLGAGFTHYFNDNLKVLAYYDWVKNESTNLNGYKADLKDDVLTVRMQLRF